MSVVYRFAHEIAHVGRIKFIEDNGEHYRKWRRLFLSKKGDSMLRKVITAFHNGSWTTAAREEYDRVKSDKSGEEFIAAMTGYFLVNDTLDVLTSLDAEEANIHNETLSIVGRILTYVRRIMDRVSSVFIELRDSDPKEFENLTGLIKRTLGWEAARPDIGNRPTRRLYLAEDGIDPVTKEQGEASVLAVVTRLDEIEARLVEVELELTFDLVGRPANSDSVLELDKESEALSRERSELQQELGELGTDRVDPLGHDTVTYIRGIEKLYDQFSVEGHERKLDVERIARRGTTADHRIFLSYLMRKMTLNMVGKNGEFVGHGLAAMDNLPFFGKGTGLWNKLKRIAGTLAVESSGASKTWNSPFTLIVMFSTLIDNSMSTLGGHWGNIEGIPHVMGAVGKIDQISDEITTAMEEINKKIIGWFQTHTRVGELAGSNETTIVTRDEVAKEIWMKVNDGNYQYQSATILNDAAIREEADRIVGLYRNLKEIVDVESVATGLRKAGFEHMIPYKFAEGKNVQQKTLDSFLTKMTSIITENIKESRKEGDLEKRRMCPFTLYSMRELPHLDDPVQGLKELEAIKKTNRALWEEIVASAIVENHYKVSKKASRESKVQAIAQVKEGDLMDTFFEGLNDTEAEDRYTELIIPAVLEIARLMANPKNRFSAKYSGFGERSKSWWNKYYESAGRPNKRLQIFFGAKRNHIFTEKRLIEGTRERGKHGNSPPISSPASIYTANIVNGSAQGVFFPQQWAIPPVQTVMNNDDVSGFLVWSPDLISKAIMKHIGTKVAEQSMFMSKYGVLGTTGDMLNIASSALSSGHLLNDDGSIIDEQDRRSIVRSIDTLKAKYDTVLGRGVGRDASADEVLNFLSKYAPDITRIVFGTNLTLATIVVENSMNMINELIGRGSITGFINAAMAPLMKFSPTIQKNVARDHAKIIRVFNSAFIPDFATPDIDVRNTWMQRAPKWLGERNMHLAGIVHEMIATSRAVIFRGWLKDATVGGDASKLKAFLKMHAEAPKSNWTEKEGRKQVASLMSRAGLPGTDAANIMYLMSEGILTEGNVDLMVEMIHSTDEYYSLGDMVLEANTSLTAEDAELGQRLEIIHGLRRAELQYIHEILVEPNPFDIVTGNSSWDTFWEVFRRYPVLFASQQIGRRRAKFSLRRNGVHLISYAIMDSLYMTALMVAAGYPLEEIMEGWKKNPAQQAAFMIFRLPHGGRYMGLIGELLGNVIWRMNRKAFGFVPIGAMESFMFNLKKLIEPIFSDEKDMDWASMIMFARIFPVIGDAITRIVWFSVMGEEYQKQNTMNMKGSSSSSDKWANYGSIYEHSDVAQWTGIARSILKELGWQGGSFNDLPLALQKIATDNMSRQQEEQIRRAPAREPVQPEAAPVSRPEKTDMISAIKAAGTPQMIPRGLID